MQIARSLATVYLCLSLLGCRSTSGNEDLALKDPTVSATLVQIRNSVITTRSISHEQFAELRSLTERFPDSESVGQTYLEALIVREDWGSLEAWLADPARGELNAERKLALGKAYVKNGRYAKGVEILEPLSVITPDDFELIALLGNCYFHLDRSEKAAPLFDRIWERLLAEKRVTEITMRGMIYFRGGDLERAKETLIRSFEIDPKRVAVNNGLSRIYTKLGNAEKAEFHRGLTVSSLDSNVAEHYRASQNVQRIIELENAWKAKEYSRVIAAAKLMLPTAAQPQRVVLYQYLFEAATATGDKGLAEESKAEIQKLQKQ